MNDTMASPSSYSESGPPIEWLPPDWPPPASDENDGGAVWPPVPPAGEPPLPALPPSRKRFPRALAAILAAILVGLGVGYGVGRANNQSSIQSTTQSTPQPTASAPATTLPASTPTTVPAGTPSTSATTVPGGVNGASSDPAVIAAKVAPGVVDINTELGFGSGAAAGTGVVVTPSGEVLTNNHVINGATSIKVTIVATGRTYTATVMGTDPTDDIAVLQLSGASGLTTVTFGDSSTVAVGNSIVALGNAGGVGGPPSVESGHVTALDQSITAGDPGAPAQELTGLIETDAALKSGESGGPMVNTSGQVIGLNTAASAGGRRFDAATVSYAVPINKALAVAKQIESGQESATVRIGYRPMLGVAIQSADLGSTVAGAVVVQVVSGSPAEGAGLSNGDVIVAVDGKTVDSPASLTAALSGHHPGDKVTVGWTDTSGKSHTATVKLAVGPAD
jgi:S1-C subfamily serine protease